MNINEDNSGSGNRVINFKDTAYKVKSVYIKDLQPGDKVIVQNGSYTEGIGIFEKKYYSGEVGAYIIVYKMIDSKWDRYTKGDKFGSYEQ
jgi:hypothetical protein